MIIIYVTRWTGRSQGQVTHSLTGNTLDPFKLTFFQILSEHISITNLFNLCLMMVFFGYLPLQTSANINLMGGNFDLTIVNVKLKIVRTVKRGSWKNILSCLLIISSLKSLLTCNPPKNCTLNFNFLRLIF